VQTGDNDTHVPSASPEDPLHWASLRREVGPVTAIVVRPATAAESLCAMAIRDLQCGHHVHLLNAYSIALADKHGPFRSALEVPALNLPDGKPLSWTSRVRGDRPPLRQVRGPQLFLDTLDVGRAHQVKHFLLGSTEEVLKTLRTNLVRQFPGLVIAGTYSPPFRALTPEELSHQDALIKASGADIVWVGLGTPKQDFEARRLAEDVGVVAIAVGAAFDFAAGSVREAPAWIRAIGMEWAYRLGVEPRRLWKRYVFGNARFLKAVVLDRNRST
jgi:N-acetylglucosaminyldiphosphoundecaprenol N-acetyl-beta-D-mannosaminyltransferase